MTNRRESPEGYEREGYSGLPFAGNPRTDHDSIMEFYFEHPSSLHNGERPLGPLSDHHRDEVEFGED